MQTIRAMTLGMATALCLLTGAAGCSRSEKSVTIPAHTPLVVSLNTVARSDRTAAGDVLMGRLAEPVLVDGQAVMPVGQTVTLHVVRSQSGDAADRAELTLAVAAIELPTGHVEIETKPLEIDGQPEGMSDGEKIAAGAVGGAVVGGIVKGSEGAVLGGILGAAAGSAVAVSTNGGAIVLPAGQRLEFSTANAIEIPAREPEA